MAVATHLHALLSALHRCALYQMFRPSSLSLPPLIAAEHCLVPTSVGAFATGTSGFGGDV